MKTLGSHEAELEQYLRKHIPISAAMGVEVSVATSDLVRLRAPLKPNLNHRSTVFGGSAAAVATLAGWSLLHMRLSRKGHGSRIVIQRGSVSYDHPIDNDFDAVALAPPAEVWQRFTHTLEKRGRARIELPVELQLEGRLVGRFLGTYVVLPTDHDD